MKKFYLTAAVCLPLLALGQTASSERSSGSEDLSGKDAPKLGIHWAKGFDPTPRMHEAGNKRNNGSGLNMTNHGGKIMPTAVTQAIFWGTSWKTYSGDKISGIDRWYSGFNMSGYAATSDEYSGTNGQVTASTTAVLHASDYSAAASGDNTAAILDTVCRNVTPDPSGNGYYAVYSDVPRGKANYCAYHSHGSCGGTPVQFAYFFNLDGDAGCDPQDTGTVTGHSQGLAALANVSAHELSEARTDPSTPGAWYDSAGEENGDKCAWTFNVPYVTFSDGTKWKVQGEWSNAAYNGSTGYANSSGQKGCIFGK